MYLQEDTEIKYDSYCATLVNLNHSKKEAFSDWLTDDILRIKYAHQYWKVLNMPPDI